MKATTIILDRHRSGLWTVCFHCWERKLISAEGAAKRRTERPVGVQNSWRYAGP
jgi:hypothetical protein